MTALGTSEVVRDLRREDYAVSPSYVNYLIREGILPAPEKCPGGALCWAEADVDRLRSILKRRGRGPSEVLTQEGGRCGR